MISGWMPMLRNSAHAMLGWFCLQFAGRFDIGKKGQMQVERTFSPNVFSHLPNRFEKRLPLDVANRPPHLDR